VVFESQTMTLPSSAVLTKVHPLSEYRTLCTLAECSPAETQIAPVDRSMNDTVPSEEPSAALVPSKLKAATAAKQQMASPWMPSRAGTSIATLRCKTNVRASSVSAAVSPNTIKRLPLSTDRIAKKPRALTQPLKMSRPLGSAQ